MLPRNNGITHDSNSFLKNANEYNYGIKWNIQNDFWQVKK
jgi:hypothetical protein